MVAAVLQIQNLDKIIANYIIRLAKGNLKLSITYLFTVTTFLSMWINNTRCGGDDVTAHDGDVKRYQCREKPSVVRLCIVRHGSLVLVSVVLVPWWEVHRMPFWHLKFK